MLPGTGDDVFWEGFSALVPELMECFKPDVIVSQLGVDSFVEDPLALLQLTTDSFCKVISFLTDRAPAWVALGGGGYDVWNVARAWTLAWAIMNGVRLPDDLPESALRLMPESRLRACPPYEHGAEPRRRHMRVACGSSRRRSCDPCEVKWFAIADLAAGHD
jgi:acetoin utilization deacetylase AcuC-like enzyme